MKCLVRKLFATAISVMFLMLNGLNQGKVLTTLLRGRFVAENGRPMGEPGYGQLVPRLEAGGGPGFR